MTYVIPNKQLIFFRHSSKIFLFKHVFFFIKVSIGISIKNMYQDGSQNELKKNRLPTPCIENPEYDPVASCTLMSSSVR